MFLLEIFREIESNMKIQITHERDSHVPINLIGISQHISGNNLVLITSDSYDSFLFVDIHTENEVYGYD